MILAALAIGCADPPPPAPEPVAAAPKPARPKGPPKKRKPAPKPCLGTPDDVEGDRGITMSQGLSEDQVRASMGAGVSSVLPCIGDSAPTTPLHLRITVACTGVVSTVEVADRGDWPEPVAACVADTLGTVEFPAHDLPDGDTFEYPLRYTAP